MKKKKKDYSLKVRTNLSNNLINRILKAGNYQKHRNTQEVIFTSEDFPKHEFHDIKFRVDSVPLNEKKTNEKNVVECFESNQNAYITFFKEKKGVIWELPLYHTELTKELCQKHIFESLDILIFRTNFFNTKRFTFFVYMFPRRKVHSNLKRRRKKSDEEESEGEEEELFDFDIVEQKKNEIVIEKNIEKIFSGDYLPSDLSMLFSQIDFQKSGFFCLFRTFTDSLNFVNAIDSVSCKMESTPSPNTPSKFLRIKVIDRKCYKRSRVEIRYSLFRFWDFDEICNSFIFSKFKLDSSKGKELGLRSGEDFLRNVKNTDLKDVFGLKSLGMRMQVIKIIKHLRSMEELRRLKSQISSRGSILIKPTMSKNSEEEEEEEEEESKKPSKDSKEKPKKHINIEQHPSNSLTRSREDSSSKSNEHIITSIKDSFSQLKTSVTFDQNLIKSQKDLTADTAISIFHKLENFVPDEIHSNSSKWSKAFLFADRALFYSCFFDIQKISKKQNSASLKSPTHQNFLPKLTHDTVPSTPLPLSSKRQQKKIEAMFEDSEEEEEINSENFKKEIEIQTLPVYLVVSDMLRDGKMRSLRKFVSPFLSEFSTRYFKNFQNFGIFHSAVILGPIYLEWNNSSFVQPREVFSSSAILCFKIGEVPRSYVRVSNDDIEKEGADISDTPLSTQKDDEEEEEDGEDSEDMLIEEEISTASPMSLGIPIPVPTTQSQSKDSLEQTKNEVNETQQKLDKKSQISLKLRMVSDFVYSWNRFHWFSRIRKHYDETNCQDFFHDFVMTLKLRNVFNSKDERNEKYLQITEFMDTSLIQNGDNRVIFHMSSEFVKCFIKKLPGKLKNKKSKEKKENEVLESIKNINMLSQASTKYKKYVHFKTHGQLDRFVRQTGVYQVYKEHKKNKKNFGFVKEMGILKAFDRAFWLRYMKKETIEENQPDKDGCVFGIPSFWNYVYKFPDEHGAVRMKKK